MLVGQLALLGGAAVLLQLRYHIAMGASIGLSRGSFRQSVFPERLATFQ